VIGRFQIVSFFEIGVLNKVAAHFRHEEQHKAEYKQENNNSDEVMDGVVRMERNTIERYSICILVLLDLDTIGIV